MKWRNAAAVVLGILVAAMPQVFGQTPDTDKALKEITEAEKWLSGQGVKKTNTALKHFNAALKLIAAGPLTEHLSGRISLGSGKAHADLKKHKEAAENLRILAQALADRVFRWKGQVMGQGAAADWSRMIQKSREEIDAGSISTGLAAELKKVVEAASAEKYQQHVVQAAKFLLGLIAEKAGNHKESVDLYLPLAEEQAKFLEEQGKRRIEADRNRPRTPSNVPAAEKPPGVLKGEYLAAVDAALDWLAKFQKGDGEWSEAALDEMSKDDPLPPARVKVYPMPVAGALATMAFLRAGVVIDDSKRGTALRKALEWAKEKQADDGHIPSGTENYWMVQATSYFAWAFADAVLMLKDPEPWKEPLRKAVGFLETAQNPGKGWRFGVKPGDNDCEVTAPALIALSRARAAGAEVQDSAIDGGLSWLDWATDEITGRTGFASKGDPGSMRADSMKFKPADTCTAMALSARALLGQDPGKGLLALGYDTLWGRPPDWVPDKDINLHYSHFYTLAYGLRPGADANYNLKRFADLLVKNQEKTKSAAGSWPPICALAADGRIAATARAILCILNARGVNLPQPLKPEKKK